LKFERTTNSNTNGSASVETVGGIKIGISSNCSAQTGLNGTQILSFYSLQGIDLVADNSQTAKYRVVADAALLSEMDPRDYHDIENIAVSSFVTEP